MLKNQRPPYLLGVLCLIPLLGGMAGLFLIAYGIFKYKDKWLILIGCAGVMLTIAIYSSLYYDLNYGETTQKGLRNVTSKQLNSLLQNIEFFKQKNGQYPDDLKELEDENSNIFIYDPYLAGDKRDNISSDFNYQRIDDKYTIFSVGPDRKPHTTDDVFPNVVNKEDYKYGFTMPDAVYHKN